ncbi:MAG: hypothetical protein U5K43_01785 [Halofilum sp. (in: g-proteobacteria)]|nr:hypothetical protein [Halofilum sp. (in: g-proteobacteria)]
MAATIATGFVHRGEHNTCGRPRPGEGGTPGMASATRNAALGAILLGCLAGPAAATTMASTPWRVPPARATPAGPAACARRSTCSTRKPPATRATRAAAGSPAAQGAPRSSCPDRYTLSRDDDGDIEGNHELDNSVGDLDPAARMEIQPGPGAGETVIEAATGFGDRAIHHHGGGTVLDLFSLRISGFRGGVYLRDVVNISPGADRPRLARQVVISDNSGPSIVFGSEVDVRHSLFRDNTGDSGAGAINASALTAANATFLRNHGTGSAGAIHLDSASPATSVLDNVTVTGDSASISNAGEVAGGGIYAGPDVTLGMATASSPATATRRP